MEATRFAPFLSGRKDMKKLLLLLSLGLLLITTPVHADPVTVPNGPWVQPDQTVQLQKFYTIEELGKKLFNIEAHSKGRLRVEVAGYSATYNYPIYVAKFGEPDENKTRIYIESSIHGDEQIHTNACVELIQTLATSGNKDILDILDKETIWIVPMLNPDGNMFTLADGTLWPQRLNVQTWTPTDWGLPADFVAPFYYGSRYGVYGFDLNRDFNPNLDFVLNPNTKNLPRGSSSQSGFFVAPESRTSAAIFKALTPNFFLDLHMQYPTYAQSTTDNGMNTLQMLAIATRDTGYTDKDGNVFPLDPEVLKLSKQAAALVYQGLTANGNSLWGNVEKYAPINYPGSALGAFQLNGSAITLFEFRGGSIYDNGQKGSGMLIAQCLEGIRIILTGFATGDVYNVDPAIYDNVIPSSGPRVTKPHPEPQQ
jgi:hypothetical protein